jgi:hypothetical protein
MAGIDLRPMTLGEVLDRTFTLYREQFLLFAGISALPYLVMLIFRFAVLLFQRAEIRNVTPGQVPGLMGSLIVGFLGGLLLLLIIVGIAHSATIWAVSELYLGRDTSVRAAYSSTKARVFIALLTTLLVGLASGVGFIFLIIRRRAGALSRVQITWNSHAETSIRRKPSLGSSANRSRWLPH